jgi:hypothetical protein
VAAVTNDPGDVGRAVARAGLGAIAMLAGSLRGEAPAEPAPSTDVTTTPVAVAAGLVVEGSAVAARVVARVGRAGASAKHAFDAVAPRGMVVSFDTRLHHLAEVGVHTAEAGRVEFSEAITNVVMPIVDPIIDRILPLVFDRLAAPEQSEGLVHLVEGIVDEVIQPILEKALPMALDQLGRDPEPVRELVWGQGVGMATDARSRVQDVARQADEHVDQIARRLRLRRRGTPTISPTT